MDKLRQNGQKDKRIRAIFGTKNDRGELESYAIRSTIKGRKNQRLTVQDLRLKLFKSHGSCFKDKEGYKTLEIRRLVTFACHFFIPNYVGFRLGSL